MKIEILKVENGKIVEPEDWEMEICMTGCGGGGGYVPPGFSVIPKPAWGYPGCAGDLQPGC
ncbi:hypothetical protein NF865_05890 [Thermococcus aggregans]|uniref:Uncharacterized protein n=1 Tax=Thermococcus aggregans TaxID=110163 RepID=A0A9E7MVU2_THEAG|nr:hypothetical protein [Thermococcus aggregans]USS39901.1 hypothetical protein NF865_05890 [Thermococcus aggregans]